MMRRTAIACAGRRLGKISSMLEMGGVAPAGVETHINVGKNNRVRAVALDFHLITRSIEERRRRLALEEKEDDTGGSTNFDGAGPAALAPVQPDASLVEQMANLLNVNLGGDASKPKVDDDISAILGSNTKANETPPSAATKVPNYSSPSQYDSSDIRSKYASKLRNKIEGGVAGLERAKSEKVSSAKQGDASMHLAARELLSSTEGMMPESKNTSSTRWLAATGVGKLLSFLSGRSMQIALLPLPSTQSHPQSDDDVKQTLREMEDLTKQLPHVNFDLLLPDGRRRRGRPDENSAEDVVDKVLSKMEDVTPLKFVVVSDREDYLKAARDNGMFTCRIRPNNKRRGNITTNYNVENLSDVQDVINDINGISFNSALKG